MSLFYDEQGRNRRCFYCGAFTISYQDLKLRGLVKRGRVHPYMHTYDHLIARWQGGAVDGPTVDACHACNVRKSGFDVEDFRDKLIREYGYGKFFGEGGAPEKTCVYSERALRIWLGEIKRPEYPKTKAEWDAFFEAHGMGIKPRKRRQGSKVTKRYQP